MKLRTLLAAATVVLAVSADARSDPPGGGPTDPPPPPELPDFPFDPITPSATVGYLPATSGVTPTGEYSYTIPIDVPAGRAGMTPALSLQYSSRSGNGLVGVGWSLSGLSTILPCAKTLASDGVADGVDFDDSDRFCLDGEKLVATAGVYGADLTEYHTERERFAKIVSHWVNNEIKFEVFTRDGRILSYDPVWASRVKGKTVYPLDSTEYVGEVTIMWVLVESRDRSGNSITYEYDKPPTSPPLYDSEVCPVQRAS